ncbi:TetR/AcrR family transcriptional regulator [Microvirga mediterraneensis]|uniref:TetR family transcriptional regulator n=1 Tax=Microvirga mediterraneensis TaxID=2754695 RepID=A0A838BW45_9HYPH|nr:TetR/AcrR family transcriptional regulator [Microvirga mediterraneensis]MBA1159085.1 TetR family transcriptional regulator [Microvirga mediterraneensis]
MPSSKKTHQQAGSTQERILTAAAIRFSMHSYEQVGLRDIAADVGVDVALVHRAFGSKEQLFAATLKQAFQGQTLLTAGDRPLGEYLADKLLKEPTEKRVAQADPLQMLIRSVAHPQAGSILRRHLQDNFLNPMSALLSDPADQRAALAAGCMLGIGMMRHILQIEVLQDGQQEALSSLIARIMDSCLGEMDPARAVDLVRPVRHSGPRAGPLPRVSGRKEPKKGSSSEQSGKGQGKSRARSRTRQ